MAKRARGNTPRGDEGLSSSIGDTTHSDQLGVRLLAPAQATAATSVDLHARIEGVIRKVEDQLKLNRGDTIQQFEPSTRHFEDFYVQDLPYFNDLIEELCSKGLFQSFNEDFILNPVNGIYLKARTQNEMKEDINNVSAKVNILEAKVDTIEAKVDNITATLDEIKSFILRLQHNPT